MNVHAIHVGHMTGAREEHERQNLTYVPAEKLTPIKKERKANINYVKHYLALPFKKNICTLVFSIFGVFIQNKSLE